MGTADASAQGPASARPNPADKQSSNWSTYFGNNKAWSYSSLDQIARGNVKNLVPVWTFAAGDVRPGLVSTPLVMDGVLYLAAGDDQLFALNAVTGRLLWSYSHPSSGAWTQTIGRNVKGIAMGQGLIYMGTSDNHLIAVDQKSGREVWNVEVEDSRLCECSIGSAPIVAGSKVIVGVTGGEVPHRGYLNAFDARTGKFIWRFFTIPGPNDPNFGTWGGDAWKMGGGPTWYTGSYDANLNLIFWGVGNASSDTYGEGRKGSNLYTDSVVAIDAGTGKLSWYFQETPHDLYDYDSAYEAVLLDLDRNGRMQRVVLHASKNGYTYVLDRKTGSFIGAWPYVDIINWTRGLDRKGQPIDPIIPEAGEPYCPSLPGGRTWGHSAYSPITGLWYNIATEMCTVVSPRKEAPEVGELWLGTEGLHNVAPPSGGPIRGHIDAFDPLTGKRKWRVPTVYPESSSLLATGGGLIFGGDVGGRAWALDANTGEKLWSYNTGGSITGAEITYSVNGRQYVAIDSGVGTTRGRQAGALFPGLKAHLPQSAANLFVFALFQPDDSEPKQDDEGSVFSSSPQVETAAAPSAQPDERPAVKGGQQIFEATCANSYCHVAGGGGSGPTNLQNRNFTFPQLIETISDGVPGTGMPSWKNKFSSTEISELAAYVSSLSPDNANAPSTGKPSSQPALPGASSKSVQIFSRAVEAEVGGNAREGRSIFFDDTEPANCGVCHAYAGKGGRVGPDLANIAGMTQREILRDILQPDTAVIDPRYAKIQITTRDGQLYVGVKGAETKDVIRLYDTSSTPPVLRTFLKSAIVNTEELKGSVMPGNYGQRYSHKDLLDLVTYIKAGDPDPNLMFPHTR
jgi:alcohol dehydrogenase (cytochrome c)